MITKEDFLKLERNLGICYASIGQLIPETVSERRLILEKQAEALMWLRLMWETYQASTGKTAQVFAAISKKEKNEKD